jgi:superfamily II DNA or RNA helicase
MVEDIPFDSLPATWVSSELRSFSSSISLWPYQQTALEDAIKVLWKYYEDFRDYQEGEGLDANQERKDGLYQWYKDNGLEDGQLNIKLSGGRTRAVGKHLRDYYPEDEGRFSYQYFINRMSFWMATGSGKSLVLIKLIQVLRDLIKAEEIPSYDLLVLTCRDDLIEQLKAHVKEFNSSRSDLYIRLRELKEYPAAKRDNPSLFKDQEITIVYYRSDNLNDEQKEKLVDFRNYDNDGKWYVFLDEAHKGDREDSKRQHIYSILSRNGFLFNFSATFTDERDLATTVCDFNLAKFIGAGYGKHIAILNQETRAFKDKEDYSNDEKQKIVLKSLMMLTYAHKSYEAIQSHVEGPYHRPLLLTLVNSVNIQDADLKLFFRELERVGKGEIETDVWESARAELWQELSEGPRFLFEDGERLIINQETFLGLTPNDLLKHLYNASTPGEIEILKRPSNRQELAFKLKSSNEPFALIKIGEISEWLKNELTGYEVNESFDDESYFDRLNEDDSVINILMGSRSFYEGWDSNRPNVINFINIGTAVDAKKFILQSVGRGVRIEPVKNKRKRLIHLYNSREVEQDIFYRLKDSVLPLESLLIFGTNKNVLERVIHHLELESKSEGEYQLSMWVTPEAANHILLIPTYKLAEHQSANGRKPAKFPITQAEFDLLRRYLEAIGDDRVLLARYDTEPLKIGRLWESLKNGDESYNTGNGRPIKNMDLIVRKALDCFSLVPEELEGLKSLEEEINHYKNIKVHLRDVKGFTDLKEKVDLIRSYKNPAASIQVLREKLESGKINLDQYTEGVTEAAKVIREATFRYEAKDLEIKHIASHYYNPLIMAVSDKVDYIKHVIKVDSEKKFINHLEKYVGSPGNTFNEFDWWYFSKIDETLDEIYIPYFNPNVNDTRKYYPDFIFWLQRGADYFIVFVDPKGPAYADYLNKIDGYKWIFEGGQGPKIIPHDGLNVRVLTFLYIDDANKVPGGPGDHWVDNLETVLTRLLGTGVSGQSVTS